MKKRLKYAIIDPIIEHRTEILCATICVLISALAGKTVEASIRKQMFANIESAIVELGLEEKVLTYMIQRDWLSN